MPHHTHTLSPGRVFSACLYPPLARLSLLAPAPLSAGLHSPHRPGQCGQLCHPAGGQRPATTFPVPRASCGQRGACAGAGGQGGPVGRAGRGQARLGRGLWARWQWAGGSARLWALSLYTGIMTGGAGYCLVSQAAGIAGGLPSGVGAWVVLATMALLSLAPAHSSPALPCPPLLAVPAGPQVTVSKSPPAAAAVVKSDNPAAAEHVTGLLQTLLLTL